MTLLLAVSWTCLLIRGHQHADVDLDILCALWALSYGDYRCLSRLHLSFTHPLAPYDAKTCFQREKMLAGREKCRLQKCPLHSLESATVGTPALVHSFPLAWEKGLGRAAPLNMRSHAPFSFSSSREGTGSFLCEDYPFLAENYPLKTPFSPMRSRLSQICVLFRRFFSLFSRLFPKDMRQTRDTLREAL